jgi:hypothetical protein
MLKSDSGLQINEIDIDYIVEQGVSGIWTYRKWNSGIAECWGKQSATVDITTVLEAYTGQMALN